MKKMEMKKPKIAIGPAEVMTMVGTRMPQSLVNIVDRIARTSMRTRSDIIRSMLVERLIACGHAAPLSIEEFAEK